MSSESAAGSAAAAGLFGHAEVLEGLWHAACDGRLAHGLLFEGPEGVGKFLAASLLVRGLFCEQGPGWPCSVCGPCKRVQSDSHPDVFAIDVAALGEERIVVGWIRPREADSDTKPQTIEHFLSLKAAEGGWRAVLIREAERMNEIAQNALLKMLEEPGQRTLLVLETARPGLLLETVRSRCVRVGFGALTADECQAILEREGLSSERAELLARWSEGSPGVALRLAARAAIEARELILGVARAELGALEAARRVWALEGDFPGRTPRAALRLRAREFLDLGLCVLRDLKRARAGAEAPGLAHGDLVHGNPAPGSGPVSSLGGAAAGARLAAGLDGLLEQWLQARQDVEHNLGPEGILDRALGALARTAAGTRSPRQLSTREQNAGRAR